MKAISRWLDRFCYNHPKLGIPELMKYIMIGNVIIYIGDLFTNNLFSWFTAFYPELILHGQIWRIFTFIFTPVNAGGNTLFTKTLFFALSTFFYYWIGTSLERHWGTTRFNVFYGTGVLLNLILGIVTYAVYPYTHEMLGGYYFATATMSYVNMSMFLSFATLYPDTRVFIYGIIPVKVKWLALLDVLFFVFEIAFSIAALNWFGAAMPIVALLNYVIFFYDDITSSAKRRKERVVHQASPQTINFKKAQKEVQQRKGYLHKCAVCGITDADNPDMDFRYCSKCNGYYCYCMDHINNHTHVQ